MEEKREPVRTGSEPDSALAYLDPLYWDERFANEEHYEWFKDYSHFRHLVQHHIRPDSSVLEVGCGNSRLCEELYNDEITDITCIDLSAVAVEKMQTRLLSKGYKGIKVLEADMLELPFTDDSFDVVVEKGTMDVLFVDSGDPWNPRPETVNKVMTMLKEIHRVLKRNGIFISITFGQPHFRRPFFHSPEFTWSMEWETFGDGFHYFFYILKKGHRLLESIGIKENVDTTPLSLYHDELIKENVDTTPLSLYHDELEGEDFLFRTNVDEL